MCNSTSWYVNLELEDTRLCTPEVSNRKLFLGLYGTLKSLSLLPQLTSPSIKNLYYCYVIIFAPPRDYRVDEKNTVEVTRKKQRGN